MFADHKYFSGILLCLAIICCDSFDETVSGDDYDEGIILQVYHSDMSDDNWTISPENWIRKSPPLSMVIWISVVLGIFVFMVIAVCFALFCKYSGKLSSNRNIEIRCPIPIIITPPSRRSTFSSPEGESNPELGFSNQGYYGGLENMTSESPTREQPPQYVHLNYTSYSGDDVSEESETPPPAYMAVAPFK